MLLLLATDAVPLTTQGCSLELNSATGSGGAASLSPGASLSASASAFRGNSAFSGGAFSLAGAASLRLGPGSSVANNTAGEFGGLGAFTGGAERLSAVRLDGVAVSGNAAAAGTLWAVTDARVAFEASCYPQPAVLLLCSLFSALPALSFVSLVCQQPPAARCLNAQATFLENPQEPACSGCAVTVAKAGSYGDRLASPPATMTVSAPAGAVRTGSSSAVVASLVDAFGQLVRARRRLLSLLSSRSSWLGGSPFPKRSAACGELTPFRES